MENQNDKILSDVMAWIEKQIQNKNFCDVSISLSVHAGKIGKVQKSLTEKFTGGHIG